MKLPAVVADRPTQLNFDALSSAINARRRNGTATLTWPGGTSLSSTLTVIHGLGRTPTEMFVTVKTGGQGEVVAAHAGNADATKFEIQAQWVNGFAPVAGVTLPVSWMVL